jgi:N-acetylmuramoyl-L-alanine amidase
MSIQTAVKCNYAETYPAGLKKWIGFNIKIKMNLPSMQDPYSKTNRAPKYHARGAIKKSGGKSATIIILFSLLVLSLNPASGTSRVPVEAATPVVVVDPGHGGNDTGAQGPDGSREKLITLSLARLIADQLASDCRVILTRSDDYRLKIAERTAVANASKADIFISLHTGGSFSRSISGSSVYFYQQFLEPALTAEPKSVKPLTDNNPTVSWDRIQTKYRTTSEKLAKLIQHRLNDVYPPPDTKAQGAPLPVLEGADMPAVVIEIGNLANPNDEKTLRDPAFLARIARAIAEGIETFLAQKSEQYIRVDD